MKKRKLKLDKEEKEIILADEKGLLKSAGDISILRNKYMNIAKNTLRKNKTITIRLAERDLLHVKAEALTVGMPYQTFIASIIHQRLATGAR
ncbi:MAG: hypothetical protein UU24_C0030G0009 [Candidatus Nomurabacteria bacterium GW2011_GWA2_40_9]|uniref:Antitoxin n=1 Tax=Candidatus Nomurabacteria bacterium GW2011_GWA2_40_9 TaxID=1618734 RepID=A0A0G0TNN6_9BACT|nr:MAG: hypothetical protein UU24_C0030G0009 [Candidatus Nomurabacteria bacterium GW2011_GWA2_40_9]